MKVEQSKSRGLDCCMADAAEPPHSSRHVHGHKTVCAVLYAKSWRMPIKTGIHLQGYSRGNDFTCFAIPEWRVQLDIGAMHTADHSLQPRRDRP